MLKLYILHTIFHKSDMFRTILNIYRDLLNIITAYVKHGRNSNTLKLVHEISADIIKFVCSSGELFHKARMW